MIILKKNNNKKTNNSYINIWLTKKNELLESIYIY